MRSARRMEAALVYLETNPRLTRAGNLELGLELPVYGCGAIKGFETAEMRVRSRQRLRVRPRRAHLPP